MTTPAETPAPAPTSAEVRDWMRPEHLTGVIAGSRYTTEAGYRYRLQLFDGFTTATAFGELNESFQSVAARLTDTPDSVCQHQKAGAATDGEKA